MDTTFKAFLAVRRKLAEEVKELTLDQLNKIPKGFNNNILWNLGHVLVVHQLLAYRLSGLPLLLDETLIQQFSKGTAPQGNYSNDTAEKIKRLLVCTADDLEQDYKSGLFVKFNPYIIQTFNIELLTIEEAIRFISIHDATHFGYVLALKRAITTRKSIF